MSPFSAVALSAYQQSETHESYILAQIDENNNPDTLSPLLTEYKKTVINSIVTVFCLDKILFRDIDGGNVQTMHNAEFGVYANKNFKDRGEREYNRDDYASSTYMNSRRKRDFKNKKIIYDGYTGRERPRDANGHYDGRTHLEHIVSAKENHDNLEMRILFTKDEMKEIINGDCNTLYTDGSLNQSKGDKPLTEWMEKQKKGYDQTNAERFGIDRKRAKSADKKARMILNEQVARKKFEHYASSMTHDGLKQGGSMAVRQALGVILTEVSITIFDEIPLVYKSVCENFSAEDFFLKIISIVKKSFERVKNKLGAIWEAFKGGFLAGVLNSFVTTIINMFITTGKNLVRLIRQAMTSVTEAIKTLFFDREGRTPGERLLAATRILLVGAATVLGVIVEQSLSKVLDASGLGAIPYIGGVLTEGLSSFAGILLTGLLSVTLMYFLDHSELVKKIVSFIDKLLIDGVKKATEKWEEANHLLDAYVANLCEIDVFTLQKEANRLSKLTQVLICGDTKAIYDYCAESGLALQFSSTEEFNTFMEDENCILEI